MTPAMLSEPLIRIHHDRRGVAAVEFALLAPLLTVMAIGVLQYSFLFYTYNAMIGAARATTRAMSVGTMTQTKAIAAAKLALPSWVPSTSFVFTIVDGKPGDDVMATITVPAAKASVFNYLPMPTTLVASFVMVKQS